MTTKYVILAAALTSFGLVSSSQANLIVNGTFETGSLTPFTAAGSVGITTQGSYNAGSAAQDGSYLAAFGAGGDSHGGSLSQSFATAVGVTYTVDFDMGVNNQGPTETFDYNVYDGSGTGGTPIASGTASSGTSSAVDPKTFSFVAVGTTSTLQFIDDPANTGKGGASDLVLDNINVNATPEPASIALLGFGALGLLARRRRVSR